MNAPARSAPDVERLEDDLRSNRYRGTADALIAAGLITEGKLPGRSGNYKTMCTYHRDDLIKKGGVFRHAIWDEHSLHVVRAGAEKFIVAVGVTKDEQKARRRAWEEDWARERNEQQAREKATMAASPPLPASAPPQPADPAGSEPSECDAWIEEQTECSAILPVGTVVVNEDGDPLVIVEPFSTYHVTDEGWRYGYAARGADGEEHFYPANELFAPDGRPTYLRLVRS